MIRTAMGKIIAILMIVAVIAIPLVTLYALSSHTALTFEPAPSTIGVNTPVTVQVANPHGIRDFTASLEQNGATTKLFETKKPADRWKFWHADFPDEDIHFNAGSKEAPNLKEGKARLVIQAQSNDFRGATTTISEDVNVVLRPPSISADGFQHYINQGGSEMVLLTPSGSWTEAGVRVGKDEYRSFPIAGRSERLALFAYPWNMPLDTAPVVFVKNSAGTEATTQISFKIFPKKFRMRDLTIDDKFLNKVVNQIDPSGSGDLVTRFLKINGEMRRQNNKTLADLRFKTADKFLWTDSFLQLANSKVESEFADVRSYIYNGKKIDQQVHLGFDLAVTAHTPVLASNDGRVVWAGPLGIYGNCIVVDHGYSLQSIYGHLSSIAVKEGDMVKRGQEMGKSGSTGLAGGDHLHYSMQIEGVQVNPVEWWDAHWIKDHIQDRLKQQ